MKIKNETKPKPTLSRAPALLPTGTRFVIEDERNGGMLPGTVHSPNGDNPLRVNCIMDDGNMWALCRRKVTAGRLLK
jgi:hypothetical protein